MVITEFVKIQETLVRLIFGSDIFKESVGLISVLVSGSSFLFFLNTACISFFLN